MTCGNYAINAAKWIAERNKPFAVVSESFGHLWTEFLEACLGLFIQRIKQLLKIVPIFVLATVSDLMRLESELDCEQCKKCAGKTHCPCPGDKPTPLGSNRLPLTFFDYCLIALLLRMHSGLPQVFGCFGHIPRKIGYPSRPKRGIGNPHLARHILNAHIVSFHQVQVPS